MESVRAQEAGQLRVHAGELLSHLVLCLIQCDLCKVVCCVAFVASEASVKHSCVSVRHASLYAIAIGFEDLPVFDSVANCLYFDYLIFGNVGNYHLGSSRRRPSCSFATHHRYAEIGSAFSGYA